jgi:hypothetical protein
LADDLHLNRQSQQQGKEEHHQLRQELQDIRQHQSQELQEIRQQQSRKIRELHELRQKQNYELRKLHQKQNQQLHELRRELSQARQALTAAQDSESAGAPPPIATAPEELNELRQGLQSLQRALAQREGSSTRLQQLNHQLEGLRHDHRQLERAAKGEREATTTRLDYFHRSFDGLSRELARLARRSEAWRETVEERLSAPPPEAALSAAESENEDHKSEAEQPAPTATSVVTEAEWKETRQALEDTRRRAAALHRAWTQARQHMALLRRDNEKAQVRQADLERHYLLLHEEVLFLRRRLDAVSEREGSAVSGPPPAAQTGHSAVNGDSPVDSEASVDNWQARLEAEFGESSSEDSTAEALAQAAVAFQDSREEAEPPPREPRNVPPAGIGQEHPHLRLLTDVFEAMTDLYRMATVEECIRFGIKLIAKKSSCETVVGLSKAKPESHEMTCLAAQCAQEEPPEGLIGQLVPLQGTLIELATHQGVPVAVSHAATDPRITEQTERLGQGELRSLLCLPLTHEGRIFGAIELINRQIGESWPPEEIHAFLYVASAIGEYIALSLPSNDDQELADPGAAESLAPAFD